jgi:hypothetical protein
MKNLITTLIVTLIMIIAILGIINPGRKQYKVFDNVEGKLTHDYFIFSIYQQYGDYTISEDRKYRLYKRYMGIAMNFYQIKPLTHIAVIGGKD